MHLLKSVYTNEHFSGLKKGVEVAGIWVVGVETNKGRTADFCISASQAQ